MSSNLAQSLEPGQTPAEPSAPALRPKSVAFRGLSRLARKFGYQIRRAEADSTLVFQQIPGWFSAKEAEMLYLLAATSHSGRILEIGHFVGRSTSALCEGIRDSGAPTEFNSYDLGFKDAEEFIAYYRRFYRSTNVPVPAEYSQLVFDKRLTTTEVARRHLARFKLDSYVQLISGDFTLLNRNRYGFIFCDAMHFPSEISYMVPHVVAASDDDCLWAFHDMNEENIAAVRRLAPAQLIRCVDTLGVFRFRRGDSLDSR